MADLSSSDREISPILALRHGGMSFTLAADDSKRLALLAQVRSPDGAPVELEVDLRAFQQQDGVSNRNFIRFKKSILRGFAKSFKGVPLLRDHDRSLEARAGTITSSTAVKIEGGLAFDQTARITAPFAVEAVLSGNLDRFSIGPRFPGLDTVECSACKCPVFTDDCFHFPGDKLEDGTRVEFIFTEAEGVEVSAVTVPAVKGTSLDGIRTALSNAGFIRAAKQRDESAEDRNMKNIAKTLGLSDDADESTIVAGIGALKARAESAESALSSERVDHTATQTNLAEVTARVAELDADGRGRDVDALCHEFAGTFPPNRNEAGELSFDPGPLEIQIRELAAKDLAGARAMLAAMPSQLPVLGTTPRSIATMASTSAAEVVSPGAQGQSENARNQRRQLGLSEESYAKFNPIDGTETAHLRDSN